MPRDDDDQPETERDGPRWHVKTAAMTPRRRHHHEAPTEPVARGSNPSPSAPSRFELGDELGRGGMGSVHAARDTVLGREVAIKQALGEDADALRLFEREAKITAQLEHPSIVPVHDAGRDEHGRPFYIMRRLDGEPLADRVRRASDVKARLALVPHVLAAVDAAAFAHARGVIHRDIKPWNILIGDYGETVLIDWGLARRLDDKEADEVFATRAVGTPGYMAPEQVRGEPLDTRADVYALGATLLHVLIGKSAIDTTPTEWMEEAALNPAPPTDKIDPEVPVELVAIVTKAMAPTAADRYASAVEMAADLRAFLAGKLVAAHRYTTTERLVRFVRRHRVAVVTASAALVAIAVTAALAIKNVVVERDRAREAQLQAIDRAELRLVERASTLAMTDPTRAVALLRTLPLTSRYMPRARDIAAKAAANGIVHGRQVHRGAVRSLALSPDGHRVASTGDDGTLQIHELQTTTSRTLVPGGRGPLAHVVWADHGATIVYSSDDDVLAAVDVASGAIRVLDAESEISALATAGSEDRVRAHDTKKNRIVEYSTKPGAAPIAIAEDARLAHLDGDRMLLVGSQTLRYVDASGEHVLWRGRDMGDIAAIALAPDGTRAAVSTMNEVIEWDLTTYAEARRWQHGTLLLFYGGSRLYANNRARGGALDLLGASVVEAAHGDWSVLWQSPAGPGIALLAQDGDLAIADGPTIYELTEALPPARAIAGRPGVPVVVVGSANGWIRWLDLRTVLPATYEIPSAAQVCAIDSQRVYVASPMTDELIALPRHGDLVRTAKLGVFGCLAGRAGSRIGLVEGKGKWLLLDGETGNFRRVAADVIGTWKDSFFYVVQQRHLMELTKTAERTAWTAPAEIRAFAVNDRWLAVHLADLRVLRVDRSSGATTTIGLALDIDSVALQPDGTLWYSDGPNLYRAKQTAVHVGVTPADIDQLLVLPDGSVLATAKATVWRVTGQPGAMHLTMLLDSMRTVGGVRSAVSIDAFSRSILTYLDTGEQIVRNTRGTIGAAVEDGVVVLYIGGTRARLEVYDDRVPQDPAQLHAWIDTATNAVLEPGSDDLEWH